MSPPLPLPPLSPLPLSLPSSTPELISPPVDTAGGAGKPLQDPVYFPPKEKLPPRRALTVNDELSVFDIHNTFRRCWFLSWDHLMANVILAQKAEDGKISWVKFTPPYHAHLVKCAVALVPRPLQKVKKVMFVYVLETLNREAPKAFFDLTKGPSLAAKAQKEKKHLAQKRNPPVRPRSDTNALFPRRRAEREKRLRVRVKPNPLPPRTSRRLHQKPLPPPTFKVDPPPTTPLEAAKRCAPKVGIAAAGPATFFEQSNVGAPPAHHSNQLNTAEKWGMRAWVIESVIDKP
ncbi:hypothetical protein BGW80DRAFT_1260523 [Lactifluus volemus]|nr:hypothetical protein BGW80DRAFT_1260523 [Lactifluus volemus]